jgi:hypothetical protein
VYTVRFIVRGQPTPIEVPGWEDVFAAVILRTFLRSNPFVDAVELIEEATTQPGLDLYGLCEKVPNDGEDQPESGAG